MVFFKYLRIYECNEDLHVRNDTSRTSHYRILHEKELKISICFAGYKITKYILHTWYTSFFWLLIFRNVLIESIVKSHLQKLLP